MDQGFRKPSIMVSSWNHKIYSLYPLKNVRINNDSPIITQKYIDMHLLMELFEALHSII